jgi:hypothetical protein
MHSAHRLCRRFGHAGANPRLPESTVETEVDLGEPREGGEARVILRTIDAEHADVVERALLQTEEIFAVHKISDRRIRSRVRDDGLVEARRCRFDHLHAGDELVVLFRRENLVAVFVPNSPNPLSGGVFLIAADRVRPADVSLAAAMGTLRRCGTGSGTLFSELAVVGPT